MDKSTAASIALMIHMALTGIALIKLFKLKNATGGLVILSILALMVPVLGPSILIIYLNKLYKEEQKNIKNKPSLSFQQKPIGKKKKS